MSVSDELNRISLTASGGQTVFNFPNILIFESSDLKVFLNGALLSGSAYTVTLSGTAPADGFVTLNSGATAGDIVIIERDILLTQPTVYNPGTAFPAKSHENALDRRAMSDSDLALEARYVPKFARGRDQHIDWAYLNFPDSALARIPVYDPVTKTITWVDADALNVEGGTPASVDFSGVTGTLDISGQDPRVLDITLPFGGAVPLNLSERWQNWYTVKDFGAVGDDTADDSAAFTSCEAASGLGWVYVPSGTYKLSSDVTLTNVVIATGAVIKPDNGTTLTITGAIVTGFSRIFDGLGSVKITFQRPIYPEWFGAVADGVTDNIPAFDKAVAACENNTCAIQLLNGVYVIGSTWNLNLEGIALSGMGSNNTRIAANFTVGDDLVITSNNACFVGDLEIRPTVTKTSGNSLIITATNSNAYSEFVGLNITDAFGGISFFRASHWLMNHCRIINPISVGITVNNTFATSVCAGKIDNSVLEKSTIAGTGILHVAGGDLIITNTIFSGFNNQYTLNPTSGVTASHLTIKACSFKNCNRAILIDRTSGSGNWFSINLTSNVISNAAVAGIIVGNSVASWLCNVNIDGNVIRVPGGARGIDLDGQAGILIDSNLFNGISGTTVGVDNDASATEVIISDNNLYKDITTDVLPVPDPPDPVIPLIFTGSKIHDFPSVAFEDEANTTVTVTGAEPGMVALAQIDTMNNLNALLVAYVSSTDTVTVALHNISDVSAIDLASGTLTVIVFNPDGFI